MGKLSVAGATVVLGGGTAVGGMALSKMFSFDSTLPKELKKFKEGDGGGCVQSLFPGLQKMDRSGISDVTSDGVSTSFLERDKKENVSGCLVINGDREEYKVSSDNKWKGNFRFLWAVQQDSKGFVVFTTATTTNDSDKKLLGKGIAYSLSKTGEAWSLSNKKEVSNDKKMDKTGVDGKFPHAHTDLTSKSFWGFMSSKDDMNKMCDESDCTGDKTSTSFEGYWVGKGSSERTTKKLGEGTSKLSEGWQELFTTTEGNMTEVVKDMTGEWEEKVGHGMDK